MILANLINIVAQEYSCATEHWVFCCLILVFSLFVLIYLLLFFIGYMVDEGLKKSKYLPYLQYGRFDYEKNINADLVIVGNSRASTSIDPAILNDRLQMRTYNLGLNGGSFELQRLAFDFYQQNNTKCPEVLLLNVDMLGLGKEFTVQRRKYELLPWCNDRRWKCFFEQYPIWSFCDKYFPLWRYRGKRWLVKKGIKEFMGKEHSGYGKSILSYVDGYICLDENLPMSDMPPILEINTDFSLIENFLQQCILQNMQVVLFSPPIYSSYLESLDISVKANDAINKLAQKYALPFLDYTLQEESGNSSNFRDYWHLNKRGVAWFSRVLADDLKLILEKNESER